MLCRCLGSLCFRLSRSQNSGRLGLKAPDLIKTAEFLADASDGKPLQSDLRRAISTTYYALFHCLARSCADMMIGGPGATKSKHAWRQTYRALEHTIAKDACKNTTMMTRFPVQLQVFATTFATMQTKRHAADYDPDGTYYRSAVKTDIALAKLVIDLFGSAPLKDRRAFAAWVLFKKR